MKEFISKFLISIVIIFVLTLFTSSLALLLAGLSLQEPIFVLYYIEASIIMTSVFFVYENFIKPFLKKE